MPQLVMPKLGLTMTEGLLTEWRVKPGDAFEPGDVLCVVETEKVANEIEAESAGVLRRHLAEEGETVPVGTPIAELEGAMSHSPSARENDLPPSTRRDPEPGSSVLQVGAAKPAPNSIQAGSTRILATPLARRLAREGGIELSRLQGSGPRGRIKAADVEAAAQPGSRQLARRDGISPSGIPETPGGVREIMPDAARLATARRVTAATREIPHFYVTHEAEISALMSLRQSLNGDATRTKISVTHMLLKAMGVCLAEMPEANRIWLNDTILAFDTADVGMVAETADGVRMPMLRNVGRKPLDRIAAEALALAERARNGSLEASDVGGGAVSISNIGMFGASGLTPIINPPQSMILGVGAERQIFRPDENGEPKSCRELSLTLACDHRIHDGALAARFLAHYVALLENPLRLLRETRTAFEV